jgi:predicted glycosyltransferase involved in capsule biosynthesis
VSDVQGAAAAVSLIVPWRGGDPDRERIWAWMRRYWVSHYPEFELIECDSGEEPFSRGNSRNVGVERSHGDVLVIADADTLVAHVDEAVRIAERGEWCLAYEQARYLALTQEATDALLKTDPTGPLREPIKSECREIITSYGGIQAMPRAAFDKVGGYCRGFVGYGGEDVAFMFAMDTLWSPHVRASGWAIAPKHPHPEEERFQSPYWPANDALCKRFEHAYRNPSAMRHLVDELASA